MRNHVLKMVGRWLVLAGGAALVPRALFAQVPPRALTQQGRLYDASDLPIIGTRDLTFKIWDGCSTGGGPFVKWTEVQTGVTFADGYFAVQLGLVTPLGSVLSGGNASCNSNDVGQFARYLEITVGTDTLSPKSLIASVPYALVADDVAGGGAWLRSGNAGTVDGADFLGTTDNKPLNIKVNGARAFRIEPNAASPNVIGGYFGNSVSLGKQGAVIGGGGSATENPNLATGDYAAICGGSNNWASSHATVGGGANNLAGGDTSTVAGGGSNQATGNASTIGGGSGNKAGGFQATVAGGFTSVASADYSTVGGGTNNIASTAYATVTGGDTNKASGDHSTVCGGQTNQATGKLSTVGGGDTNKATGLFATVAGGSGNVASGGFEPTVGGGANNKATSADTTIGGGLGNQANGAFSTIPGGYSNQTTAGADYSFAAGTNAVASAVGQFVWSDSSTPDFTCATANRFCARATGGFHLVTSIDGTGANTAGAILTATSGGWTIQSDRNIKDDVEAIRPEEILAKLMTMPVSTWRYKRQKANERHLGPMAQDFFVAYHLGDDDKYISSVDANGVAFGAIQGLFQVTKQRQEALEQAIQMRDDRIASLEARLAKLEQGTRPGERHTWFPVEGSWIAIAGIALTGTAWARRKNPRDDRS